MFFIHKTKKMKDTKLDTLPTETLDYIWTFEGSKEDKYKKCITELNEKNNNHIRPRILVWFHCQIQPATIYKNSNNLDYSIHVINSKTIINQCDIVYNFN